MKKNVEQLPELPADIMPVYPVNVVRFKTPYNAPLFPGDDEVNPLPSLTIPDQSMSVREIMIRHANGLPFQAGKVPVYEGAEDFDDFLPNLATLDISERQELYERSQEYIKKYRDSEVRKRKKEEEEKLEVMLKAKWEQARKAMPPGGASYPYPSSSGQNPAPSAGNESNS